MVPEIGVTIVLGIGLNTLEQNRRGSKRMNWKGFLRFTWEKIVLVITISLIAVPASVISSRGSGGVPRSIPPPLPPAQEYFLEVFWQPMAIILNIPVSLFGNLPPSLLGNPAFGRFSVTLFFLFLFLTPVYWYLLASTLERFLKIVSRQLPRFFTIRTLTVLVSSLSLTGFVIGAMNQVGADPYCPEFETLPTSTPFREADSVSIDLRVEGTRLFFVCLAEVRASPGDTTQFTFALIGEGLEDSAQIHLESVWPALQDREASSELPPGVQISFTPEDIELTSGRNPVAVVKVRIDENVPDITYWFQIIAWIDGTDIAAENQFLLTIGEGSSPITSAGPFPSRR